MESGNTYFAPAERVPREVIASEIKNISDQLLVTELLNKVSGLLAVLDDHRQILALNQNFFKTLDLDNAEDVLGLRIGQLVHCVHAEEKPHGCGTTPFCGNCGAAVATVVCLAQDREVQKKCVLAATRDGLPIDLVLKVQASPFHHNGQKFVLLFLQDISDDQHRQALERAFFHDVNNILTMLVANSEILKEDAPSEFTDCIHNGALRLSREVDIQRYLSSAERDDISVQLKSVSVQSIMNAVQDFFSQHPAAQQKEISYTCDVDTDIQTESVLVQRILSNMILNALESTTPSEPVKVWVTREKEQIKFCVWNSQSINTQDSRRIFQRNFSTKKQAGRGLGTYSMKLLGEKLLGGDVSFISEENSGTIFTLRLPIS